MTTELERAKTIAARIAPGKHPEFACMLVASALAGMRGLSMRHVRIGALFWPDRFNDDPYLSLRGGWGCAAYSQADRLLYLADQDIDKDGGFSGHTWLEPEYGRVVDLMHDNEGSPREILDASYQTVGRYIPRRKLEIAVKNFWRPQMEAALRFGKLRAARERRPNSRPSLPTQPTHERTQT
jgi:hypothetical protein